MTKKKRQRKEQHHQRGNPPPPQVTPLLDPYDRPVAMPPANLRFADETQGDDLWDVLDELESDPLDGFDSLLPEPGELDAEYALRPMERNLMRIQRWLERKGITVTAENEQEVERLLENLEWQREPEVLATPQERAQALIYDAFELPEDRWQERIPLAKEALRISHNCADAHTLLAELDSPTDEVMLRHYRDAVKAAERAFKDLDVTARPRDYWYLMKLRPLLRALAGQADNEYVAGHHDRSLEAYRRLYAIDQLDVMDRRDGYIGVLMEQGRDDEVIRFLEQQGRLDALAAESTHIQYAVALARFRLEGDSEPAREALGGAVTGNRVIPRYLLGAEKVHYDAMVFPGADTQTRDATEYYLNDSRLWLRTPNAIEWLRANAAG